MILRTFAFTLASPTKNHPTNRSAHLRKPIMNSLLKILMLFAAACCFTGCETAARLITIQPRSQVGKTSILISLHEQRAFLIQGKERVAEASISTGREGYATPVGNFHVIRKDPDHRSG